jgi:hypothetical protein
MTEIIPNKSMLHKLKAARLNTKYKHPFAIGMNSMSAVINSCCSKPHKQLLETHFKWTLITKPKLSSKAPLFSALYVNQSVSPS